MGSKVISVESSFCSTHSYVHEPINRKIFSKKIQEYQQAIPLELNRSYEQFQIKLGKNNIEFNDFTT